MSWSETRFESLYAEPSRNGVYKPKEHHGRGTKIVNMGELFAYEFIGQQEMSRLEMSDHELEKSGLQDGDLLFGRRSLVEAGAGKCSIVEGVDEPMTFESSMIRARLDPSRCEPRFYYYWFRSPQGRGRIRSIVSGTNVKGIRGSDLKNLPVVQPDFSTQCRVVETLRAYDDLIENNRRRIALLEEAARLLYREWFVHLRFPGHEHARIIDGLPKGWERRRLIDLADVAMGQSPKSQFYNDSGDGLPFHQGVTDYGFRFVSHRKYSTKVTKIAEAGDILLSVRAPVGRINITPDKIVLGRGLSAIRSRTGEQSFLFYALRNHFYAEDIIGSGAIYAATNKKELESQELLVPSNVLQKEFDAAASTIDEQIANLTTQNEKLAQARDLLLPRLMNGEIAV